MLFPAILTQVHEYKNWTISIISHTDTVQVAHSSSPVEASQDKISLNFITILEGIAYFSAPKEFLGNKLTSYGNNLTFTILYDGLDGKYEYL